MYAGELHLTIPKHTFQSNMYVHMWFLLANLK